MLRGRRIRLGAQPINWSNDDFHELGGETPLDTCLSEMRTCGYEGTEVGHKFPRDPARLREILGSHGLSLVSGWHSTHLVSEDFRSQAKAFSEQLDFLVAMGCGVAIVAECSGRVYTEPSRPLSFRCDDSGLTKEGWAALAEGLEKLCAMAADRGVRTAYHEHMGTVVQSAAEIDRLMESCPSLGLLVDTGHMTFAGVDPVAMVRRYARRVTHVHLKDIRRPVLERVRMERQSFHRAVVEGVFTVPGEGCVDYDGVFRELAAASYEGWMVVEAEQDPAKANPREYATRAREFVRRKTGL